MELHPIPKARMTAVARLGRAWPIELDITSDKGEVRLFVKCEDRESLARLIKGCEWPVRSRVETNRGSADIFLLHESAARATALLRMADWTES